MSVHREINESGAIFSIRQELTMNVSRRIIEDLVDVVNRLYALDCYLAECGHDRTLEEIRNACIKPALHSVSLSRWLQQVKQLTANAEH